MNVRLRDVESADLPLFFEHQRDPEAVAMVMFNSRDRPAFDEHWQKILANKTGLTKTIVVDGQTAGHIVSFIRDGELEIGYWLDRAFWGRGIATRALSAFLQLEQRRPLHAGVAKHNLASIRPAKMRLYLVGFGSREMRRRGRFTRSSDAWLAPRNSNCRPQMAESFRSRG